jgi:DNA-binding transcriptional ArsR family regulator
VDAFAALADPVRRDLLVALAAGPARVVDLTERHAITRPAISRHLRVLGEAGLVTAETRGRERHYALDAAGLAPVTAYLRALGPPVPERLLDGLHLEVRRTVRDSTVRSDPTEETA